MINTHMSKRLLSQFYLFEGNEGERGERRYRKNIFPVIPLQEEFRYRRMFYKNLL